MKLKTILTAIVVFSATLAGSQDGGSARLASANSVEFVQPSRLAAPAEAYCRFLSGSARSESSVLMTPVVFSTIGQFNSMHPSAGTVDNVLLMHHRIYSGASFNLWSLTRGVAMRRRAQADCIRYRAESELQAFVDAHKDIPTPAALAAKVRVLEDALPKAESILQETREDVEHYMTTMDELHATQVRVDSLHFQLQEAREQEASLADAHVFTTLPIAELIRAHDAAASDVERYDRRARQATPSWNVEFQGGYDRISSSVLGHVSAPFYMVTTSISVGALFQRRPQMLALQAQREWISGQLAGVDQRARDILKQLRAVQRLEQVRLEETSVLLRDLEGRKQALEGVGGKKAKAFADYLWFELVKTTAENEYLRAHLQDLAVIGGDSVPGVAEGSNESIYKRPASAAVTFRVR